MSGLGGKVVLVTGAAGGTGRVHCERFAETAARVNLLPVPWVDPVDVANASVFLASDEART